MSINMSEAWLGYLLIGLGVIVAAGMIFSLATGRAVGYRVKVQHLAFPIIAIVVGAMFALGLNDRSSRPCEPRPGESFCLPGASANQAP